MYDSFGDIDGKSVTVVDPGPGDMRVSGTIKNGSFVYLVSMNGNIVVDGWISENSTVILVSTSGSITISGSLFAGDVTLKAATGTIDIGSIEPDPEEYFGGSKVSGEAGGNVTVHGEIRDSTVSLRSHADITIDGDITGDKSNVWQIADGAIRLQGKIDSGSRVDLVSNRGPVIIYRKLDGESRVSLTAKTEIRIGEDPSSSTGAEDRKIDGNCCVTALAGGFIYVHGRIAKDHTHVDLVSGGAIRIDGGITNKAQVRLLALGGPIQVPGGLRDGGTMVTWFVPPGAPGGSDFNPSNDGATLTRDEWAVPDIAAVSPDDLDGYWWENYPQTFGYVAPFRLVPRSVDAIAAAIGNAGMPVKAIGGGYSFSDVALPQQTAEEVDRVSTQLRGAWQHQNMRHVLEGLDDSILDQKIFDLPMDLLPQAVGRNQTFSTAFHQLTLRQVTNSGSQLPRNAPVLLIDTRSLASSLQESFQEIKGPNTVRQDLFHVEAGITMADLQQLLDHQQPRMAIDDSSTGPSGATLAGVLSTCTHGAAFQFPVLADRVRAVHLVGAGG